MPDEQFDFPTHIWATLLYDFAIAYKNGVVDKEQLLNSLIPIYFGKTLSYVRKTDRMTIQEAEEFIENECLVFEETKPYLLERWSA